MFWILGPYQMCDLQIISPVLYVCGGVPFDTHTFLILMKSTLSTILFVCAVGVLSKNRCLIPGHEDSNLHFLLRVL